MNQPAFNTEIRIVPVSAWDADGTLVPTIATRPIRPARNWWEIRMLVFSPGLLLDGHRTRNYNKGPIGHSVDRKVAANRNIAARLQSKQPADADHSREKSLNRSAPRPLSFIFRLTRLCRRRHPPGTAAIGG